MPLNARDRTVAPMLLRAVSQRCCGSEACDWQHLALVVGTIVGLPYHDAPILVWIFVYLQVPGHRELQDVGVAYWINRRNR